MYTERDRSGHNGADSKDSIPKVRTSANFSDCTRDPPGSNFQNFISFLRVVLLFSKTGYTHEIYGELSEWSKVQHSKDSIPKVRTSANFSDCTRDPPGSNFQNFISFLRVVLLFSKTGYTHEIYGELSEWSKVQHSKCALALAVFSAENP